MSTFIYNITTHAAWLQAEQVGYYTNPSLALEGFIHCSTSQQVKGVLERYFVGKTDLVKLVIDPVKLQSHLKYEIASSVNEAFPHIFGTINLDAVIEVQNINKTNTL